MYKELFSFIMGQYKYSLKEYKSDRLWRLWLRAANATKIIEIGLPINREGIVWDHVMVIHYYNNGIITKEVIDKIDRMFKMKAFW